MKELDLPGKIVIKVYSAKNLGIKGENSTNNTFVKIFLEEHSVNFTKSIPSSSTVEWNEVFELDLPYSEKYPKTIQFEVFHRDTTWENSLGYVLVPLPNPYVMSERPFLSKLDYRKWISLCDGKDGAQLQIRVYFIRREFLSETKDLIRRHEFQNATEDNLILSL